MSKRKNILVVKCPQCGAQTAWQKNSYRPFCGERCKTTDLGKWADEAYSVPSADSDSLFPDNPPASEKDCN